ncbi:DivIVA domain-containing protein [Saccharopolyspora sp. ASAGF58]|uniref:DivIVA domain-containing protein n=1 Tax=Saccharopolyspora sp. ASAGF58 TaxID=2719023 RepID=UPI0014401FD5|nr:DivIVA domain-containing protein [Saccharopolyspora sp. ASAGF58]QIZ38407.1 DivIVA domain-containing protein [Saccharopolyspora sp. ASAGF58]
MLTPDDVHNVAFARTWRRSRGFDEAEVDEFLERVEATLRGKRLVTVRDVLTARFSPGKPGRAYKRTQVAEFLDQIALTLMKLEVRESERRGQRGSRTASERKTVVRRVDRAVAAPRPEPAQRVAERVPPGRVEVFDGHATSQSALDKAEVDAFMDRVEATLRGADTLTAQDVLGVRFNPPGPGQPGYQEASVFAFLVMVSTIIKHMTPRQGDLPTRRIPIGRTFPRPVGPEMPQLTSEAIGSVVLSGSTANKPGYDEAQVDDFLDRVAATLRGTDTLTSKDVQAVVFREQPVAGAGYDQAEVESLLGLIADRLDSDAPPAPVGVRPGRNRGERPRG